jgi:NAD(P)-dependent dehydrogenase (short-subunit alcohol dehydrogenase family)
MPLKLRVEGKVAIVTGAGSRTEGIGNGRTTALLFAREGARVLVDGQRAGTYKMANDSKGPEGKPYCLQP